LIAAAQRHVELAHGNPEFESKTRSAAGLIAAYIEVIDQATRSLR